MGTEEVLSGVMQSSEEVCGGELGSVCVVCVCVCVYVLHVCVSVACVCVSQVCVCVACVRMCVACVCICVACVRMCVACVCMCVACVCMFVYVCVLGSVVPYLPHTILSIQTPPTSFLDRRSHMSGERGWAMFPWSPSSVLQRNGGWPLASPIRWVWHM